MGKKGREYGAVAGDSLHFGQNQKTLLDAVADDRLIAKYKSMVRSYATVFVQPRGRRRPRAAASTFSVDGCAVADDRS